MITLNDYYQNIFCINLDRRTDRWSECIDEFKKHNLQVQRFSAVDGNDLRSLPGLTKGNVGAIYSHRAVIQHAKDSNFENILILEDDIEFHDDMNKLFSEYIKELPSDWDMLFFGANHSQNNVWMVDPLIQVTDHVYKIIRSYANHCYVVKHTAYDKLIDALSRKDKPNDVLVSDVQKELNCYLFRPHLAWQRPSYSDLQEEFADYSFLKN
jgi:GR25 family glycosyltransferase involved in LPS biosynthesis